MSVRVIFALGSVYVGTSLAMIATDLGVGAREGHAPRAAAPVVQHARGNDGQQWFAAIKGRCNPLEIAVALQDAPPPPTSEGAGYAAACWALAGKIDQARKAIQKLGPRAQSNAAAVVFGIAHPVADRGDDVAAGPMMEFVLEFNPNDYMALYHAGMSQYALGKNAQAVANLMKFRKLYTPKDFFGNNADQALDRLRQGLPPTTQSPGAHD